MSSLLQAEGTPLERLLSTNILVLQLISTFLGIHGIAKAAPACRILSTLCHRVRRCYLSCPRKTAAAVQNHLIQKWLCLPYCCRSQEDIAMRKKYRSRKTPHVYFAFLMRTINVFFVDTRKDFPFHHFTSANSMFWGNSNSASKQMQTSNIRPNVGKSVSMCKEADYHDRILLVSHTEVEWMLTHKDQLALNLRKFHGAKLANKLHPEAFALRRGKSKGSFKLPDGIGRRLYETSIHGKIATITQKEQGGKRSRKSKNSDGLHRWIIKPATDSCGHGIQIFDGHQAIMLHKVLDQHFVKVSRPMKKKN